MLLLPGGVVGLLGKLGLLLVGVFQRSEVVTDLASVFEVAVGHFHFGGLGFGVVVGFEFSFFVLLAVEVIHIHPILILGYSSATLAKVLLGGTDSLKG